MSTSVINALKKGGTCNNLSVAELKEFLKSKNMVASGDKGMLWARAQLLHKVESNDLKSENGLYPTNMKAADLRKACAKAGLSPIGTNDELMFSLVDHLMKSATSTQTSNSTTIDTSNTNIVMARKVLNLHDEAIVDPIVVLKLIDPVLTPQSPTASLRKAYLKLSLMIHPDRLGNTFEQATKSFQILVSAFEQLTEPELMNSAQEDEGSRKKTASSKKTIPRYTLSRSNDGCYRTRIFCPRCKEEWTTGGVEGNPEWYYNIFMTGLKSFTCATCLCLFGCMTAIHKCPHCKGPFEYSPQDFHRKIQCGSHGSRTCNKTFGFHMYHISPRNEDILRSDIKKQREARSKLIESTKRRNQSAQRRRGNDENDSTGVDTSSSSINEEEQAFVMRLTDSCPRCGKCFLECADVDAQRLHLAECNDVKAQKAHRLKKQKERLKQQEKEKLENQQEDVESLAAWQFLGSKPEQLWLLSEDQLEKQCEERGLSLTSDVRTSSSGTTEATRGNRGSSQNEHTSNELKKHEMIAALVKSSDLVVGGSGSTRKANTSFTVDSLPDNWRQLSLLKLRSILACTGVVADMQQSKDDIIALVEAMLCGDKEADEEKAGLTSNKKAKLLLSNGEDRNSPSHAKKPKSKRKAVVVDISDSDSDYELVE